MANSIKVKENVTISLNILKLKKYFFKFYGAWALNKKIFLLKEKKTSIQYKPNIHVNDIGKYYFVNFFQGSGKSNMYMYQH